MPFTQKPLLNAGLSEEGRGSYIRGPVVYGQVKTYCHVILITLPLHLSEAEPRAYVKGANLIAFALYVNFVAGDLCIFGCVFGSSV